MVCKVSCMQKANWVVYSGITEFKRDLSSAPSSKAFGALQAGYSSKIGYAAEPEAKRWGNENKALARRN